MHLTLLPPDPPARHHLPVENEAPSVVLWQSVALHTARSLPGGRLHASAKTLKAVLRKEKHAQPLLQRLPPKIAGSQAFDDMLILRPPKPWHAMPPALERLLKRSIKHTRSAWVFWDCCVTLTQEETMKQPKARL